MRVIDAQTIELYATQAAALSAAVALSASNVNGQQPDRHRRLHRRHPRHLPVGPALGFKLTGVDITVDGNGQPTGHAAAADNIYVGIPLTVPNGNPAGHGLSEDSASSTGSPPAPRS